MLTNTSFCLAGVEKDVQELFASTPKLDSQEKMSGSIGQIPKGKDEHPELGNSQSNFESGLENADGRNDPIMPGLSHQITQHNEKRDGKIKISSGDIQGMMNKKHGWRKPLAHDPIYHGELAAERQGEGATAAISGFAESNTSPKWKTRPTRSGVKLQETTKTCIEAAMPTEKKQTLNLHVDASYRAAASKEILFDVGTLRDGYLIANFKTGNITRATSYSNYIALHNTLGEWADEDDLELRYLGGTHWLGYVANPLTGALFDPYDYLVITLPDKKNNYNCTVSNTYGGMHPGIHFRWRAHLPEKIIIRSESWVPTVPVIAELASQGICKPTAEVCTAGFATRNINGLSITRPCWTKEITYLCEGSTANECAALEKQSCTQIGSEPHRQIADFVVEYKQTFRCGGDAYSKGVTFPPEVKEEEINANVIPEDYQDFGGEGFTDSMVQFHVLKEMARELEDKLGGVRGDEPNATIFHNENMPCKKVCGSAIMDCCNFRGWFKGYCSKYEKTKNAVLGNRCHYLGEYCKKKEEITGLCLVKEKQYACFGSKLARIIQEIARDDDEQTELREAHVTDLSWGTAESPRNLSLGVDAMSLIDFGTPFARSHLAEFFHEQESLAATRFESIRVNSVDPTVGLEAKAKAAGAELTQHIGEQSVYKGPRPESNMR